jgi:purine nucleosidase
MRLLIDTDPGVDDALALFLALTDPSISLEGISVCFGNVGLGAVSRNARFLCDIAGASDVSVGVGASRPLAQESIESVVHGEGGLGRIEVPEGYRLDRNGITSADLYDRFLREGETERGTVVVLGPLTNVAEALQRAPERFKNCDRIVILGGTLAGPGNKGPVAEFNFRCDPEAADYVLAHCPCELVIVPLDLCFRNVLSLDELSRVNDESFRAFLVDLCEGFAEGNESEEGISGLIMYDPLALYCALKPQHFSFERFWMRVDTGNSFARGMSVVDRRLRPNPEPNVRIATDVEWSTFVCDFFQALNRVPFRLQT